MGWPCLQLCSFWSVGLLKTERTRLSPSSSSTLTFGCLPRGFQGRIPQGCWDEAAVGSGLHPASNCTVPRCPAGLSLSSPPPTPTPLLSSWNSSIFYLYPESTQRDFFISLWLKLALNRESLDPNFPIFCFCSIFNSLKPFGSMSWLL